MQDLNHTSVKSNFNLHGLMDYVFSLKLKLTYNHIRKHYQSLNNYSEENL